MGRLSEKSGRVLDEAFLAPLCAEIELEPKILERVGAPLGSLDLPGRATRTKDLRGLGLVLDARVRHFRVSGSRKVAESDAEGEVRTSCPQEDRMRWVALR